MPGMEIYLSGQPWYEGEDEDADESSEEIPF